MSAEPARQVEVSVPFQTLPDVLPAARAALPPQAWDYLDGGAGDEITLRGNLTEFARWEFRPRVMSGLPAPRTATSLLGMPLSMPVLTAPFGSDGLFHPDGQLAIARANAACGIISMVPEAGTHPLEEVARAAPAAARIAQLHPLGSPENFRAMLKRIEDAGFDALCVTLDCPTAGWRERDLRRGFTPGLELIGGNYAGRSTADLAEVFGQLFSREAPVWSWELLAERMAESSLPWIAKGILTGEDARAAVAAGASAILVSNHGGRQLDGAPPALRQLPEVVDAVGERAEVLLDSGVRRGSDVVKAVALGARAVVIGRLAAGALAAGGQAGVEKALQLLHQELTTVLTLLGRGSITDVDRAALARAER